MAHSDLNALRRLVKTCILGSFPPVYGVFVLLGKQGSQHSGFRQIDCGYMSLKVCNCSHCFSFLLDKAFKMLCGYWQLWEVVSGHFSLALIQAIRRDTALFLVKVAAVEFLSLCECILLQFLVLLPGSALLAMISASLWSAQPSMLPTCWLAPDARRLACLAWKPRRIAGVQYGLRLCPLWTTWL